MLEELTNEAENLRRDDLEANLILLQKCREFLHCNHSLLTELRVRIIPIICRQSGKTTKDFSDQIIEHKKKLCQENLAVFKVIAPGLTRQRGGCLFELQDCKFFLAKRQYEDGKMAENKFTDLLIDCKKILIECLTCLNNEPHNSIEKYYEKSANVSLKFISETVDVMLAYSRM